VIVDPDFLDHWRVGMVADAISDPMAPLYILRLWAHCQERKSVKFVMPAAGLKAQCKCPADAARFEAALIEAGFLERDGATIVVLGWAEKNASLIAAWENGAKGGRPKKNPSETHGKPTVNPRVTQSEPMGNPHETDKIREEESREELSDEANASSSSPEPTKGRRAEVPCPYEAIVQAYTEELPTLPGVRVMDAKRQKAIRTRWVWVLSSKRLDGTRRATNGDEAMEWFRGYFARVRANSWLMGETPSRGHENWKADLDFLMTDRGLKAVIERTEVAA
jgi:hypothetical protein